MYLAGWFGEADKISIFLKEGESGICKREAEISKIGMSWRLSNVLKGKRYRDNKHSHVPNEEFWVSTHSPYVK